jgi:hypothetical protein
MKLSKAILSPNNPRCKVGFARTRCLTLPDADNKKWWTLVHHFLRASLFKIRPYEINPTGRNDDQGHIFFVGNRINGLSQMRKNNIIV